MRIAITAKGTEWNSMVDPRFGRCDFLLIYNDENAKLIPFDNRATGQTMHGAGPKTAQTVHDFQAEVLITGNGPGENAARVLEMAGIKVYTGAGTMTIKDALSAYRNDSLQHYTVQPE